MSHTIIEKLDSNIPMYVVKTENKHTCSASGEKIQPDSTCIQFGSPHQNVIATVKPKYIRTILQALEHYKYGDNLKKHYEVVRIKSVVKDGGDYTTNIDMTDTVYFANEEDENKCLVCEKTLVGHNCVSLYIPIIHLQCSQNLEKEIKTAIEESSSLFSSFL